MVCHVWKIDMSMHLGLFRPESSHLYSLEVVVFAEASVLLAYRMSLYSVN